MILLLISAYLASTTLAPLIAPADYPPQALRMGWQGDVGVDLIVSKRGRVVGCTVYQSSGHDVLDDATCKIFFKRARFKPATDADGNPIKGNIRMSPVKWRLGA